jgi:hypothetical protein
MILSGKGFSRQDLSQMPPGVGGGGLGDLLGGFPGEQAAAGQVIRSKQSWASTNSSHSPTVFVTGI